MAVLLDELYAGAWWALGIAVLVTWLLVPVVRAGALAMGVVSAPDDERRVHTRATPLLGGVAMLAGVVAATVAFAPWDAMRGIALLQERQLIVVLMCAALVCLLGALDDAFDLSWRLKLGGQVALATAVVVAPILWRPDGLSVARVPLVVDVIDLPFLPAADVPLVLGIAVVVVWIVAVMNMLNFIDGVDGLAAGQTAIIAATFAIIAASYGRLAIAVLAAATCGAALGFLPHNWRRGGARIFMGDSGSMLLGFLLAVIAVQGVLKTTAAISLVIPLALLAVPIIDTSFVVLKRIKHGVPVSSADRWHLHHRLLNVGLSPRRVAAALWAWTAAMSLVALALRFVDYGNSSDWRVEGLLVLGFVVAGAVAVSLVLVYRLEIIKSRRVRERNRARAEALARADTDRG
jgi:UDP-GlcNAc:undecaprenyl-phosphate GlcNAc-1-phosphate transferase